MNSFAEKLTALFFPTRCRSCGELLDKRRVLCERCRRDYDTALLWECGLCGRPPAFCTCTVEQLERARVRRLIKLFRYRADSIYPAANSLLYRAKRKKCALTVDFFAEQLAEAVRRHLPDHREFCVTYAPRTPREYNKYGFDQSALLARALAKKLGIPFCACLKRRRRAVTQKTAENAVTRLRNVSGTVLPRRRVPMRRVLLVDDVVTTGATMAECARVLRKNGAREVVAVALAFVAHNPNQKYEEQNRVP